EGFTPEKLRRYQLRTILGSYNVNVPSTCSRADMLQLFRKHVEINREAILLRHKQEAEEKQKLQTKSPMGRGQRMRQRSRKFENSGIEIKTKTKPTSKRSIKTKKEEMLPQSQRETSKTASSQVFEPPSFTAEDSFASSDEDQWIAQKPKVLHKYRASPEVLPSHRSKSPEIALPDISQQHNVLLNVTNGHSTLQDQPEHESGGYSDDEDQDYCADSSDIEDSEDEVDDEDLNMEEVTLLLKDECVHDSKLGRYVMRAEKHIKRLLAQIQGETVYKHMLENHGREEAVSMKKTKVSNLVRVLVSDEKLKIPEDKQKEVMDIAMSDGEDYFGTEDANISIWRQLHLRFEQVKHGLLVFMCLLPVFILAVYSYQWYKASKKRMGICISNLLDILRDQSDKHSRDPAAFPDPGCPVSQLRGTVIDISNPQALDEWTKITEAVANHPHIQRRVYEIRGEPCEFWEFRN
ncbi:hypothetical protein DFQ30_001403, partial [Apophysomyces sp. BC1015]